MIRKIISGTVALVAIFVFAATFVRAVAYSPETEVTATNIYTVPIQHAQVSTPAEYPVRLIIPSIGVDAKVQYVGITARGAMSVPNNFTDVGWYKYGPLPGNQGSAVMAGHVDNALGLPGVFKRLQDMKVGDAVYVRTKNGSMLHFAVDDIQSYTAADAPASRIFDSTGTLSRLNLVTCEGDWIQSERQYDHRLVIYTHLVDSEGAEAASSINSQFIVD